jgi:hypothetical protein
MAIASAPNNPEEADAPKAEVHDNVDVVDDPSREVSKKRQSLSDLFTIVSDSFSFVSSTIENFHPRPLLINGSTELYSLPAASL